MARDAGKGGAGGGPTCPLALFQGGQGGKRRPFNLLTCMLFGWN